MTRCMISAPQPEAVEAGLNGQSDKCKLPAPDNCSASQVLLYLASDKALGLAVEGLDKLLPVITSDKNGQPDVSLANGATATGTRGWCGTWTRRSRPEYRLQRAQL